MFGVFLTGARIPQALAEHGIDVEVGDDEAVLEGWATGDDRPIRTAYDTGAVEYQLVLPAHGVQVGDENAVVGGAGGDHALALGGLAGVEGRRVDVDNDLGAGVALDGGGADGIPDVLADVDADVAAVDDINGTEVAAPEVAVLIEHAVVGQVHLAVPVEDTTVVDDGGGVGDVVADLDASDDDGDAPGRGGDALDGGGVVGKEGWLEEEVLGRIAGNGKLREGNQVGVGGPGLVNQLDDAGGVAGNVADGGVELAEGQPEGALHWGIIAQGGVGGVAGINRTGRMNGIRSGGFRYVR